MLYLYRSYCLKEGGILVGTVKGTDMENGWVGAETKTEKAREIGS